MELRKFHLMASIFLLRVSNRKSKKSKEYLKQLLGALKMIREMLKNSWAMLKGLITHLPPFSSFRESLIITSLERSFLSPSRLKQMPSFFTFPENHILFPSEDLSQFVILRLFASQLCLPPDYTLYESNTYVVVKYCTLNTSHSGQ